MKTFLFEEDCRSKGGVMLLGLREVGSIFG